MMTLKPRKNAAAWRNIKCPVCKAPKNATCVNVRVEPGKERKAHLPRILAANEKRTTRRNGRPHKHSPRKRIIYS